MEARPYVDLNCLYFERWSWPIIIDIGNYLRDIEAAEVKTKDCASLPQGVM